MSYGIALAVLGLLAQAAGEGAAGPKGLEDARRLLQNGRYGEAEEAYSSVEAEAKKKPGGVPPALKLAVELGRAECQASQGEYARAIQGLEGLGSKEPKDADVAARLAELKFDRGDWEAADAVV